MTSSRCPAVAFVSLVLGAAASAQMPDPPSRVEVLVGLVASDAPAIRSEGAAGIGLLCGAQLRYRPLDAAIERLVILGLMEDESETAVVALQSLWRLDPLPHHVTSALALALPSLRACGARKESVDAVERLLQSPGKACVGGELLAPLAEIAEDEAGRATALAALAVLGRDAAALAPRMRALLDRVPEAEQWRVAMVLAAIGDADALLASRTAEHPRLRLAAALALHRSGRTDLPADAVLPWLDDPRAIVRASAIEALPSVRDLPPGAVAKAAAFVREPLLVPSVHDCLSRLGPRANAAAEPLLALLPARESDAWADPEATLAVVEALARIGPGAEGAIDPLLLLLRRSGTVERSEACGRALARIAQKRAVSPLFAQWQAECDDESPLAGGTATALVALGPTVAGDVGVVLTCIAHESARVRSEVLSLLLAMGPGAFPALPQLLAMVPKADPAELERILAVVAGMGPRAFPSAITALQRIVDASGEGFPRTRLLIELHRMTACTGLVALLRAGPDGELGDGEKAVLAMVGLAELVPAAGRAAPSPELEAKAGLRIRELLEVEPADKEHRAVKAKLRELLHARLRSGIATSEPFLRAIAALGASSDSGNRRLAGHAQLVLFGPRLEPCWPVVEFAFDKDVPGRMEALRSEADFARWMVGMVRRDHLPIQDFALRILPRFAGDGAADAAGVAAVLDCLARGRGDPHWGTALDVLEEYGARARSALPALLDQVDREARSGATPWEQRRLLAVVRAVRDGR